MILLMKIIVDYREQSLYDELYALTIKDLTPPNSTVETDNLDLGDIVLKRENDEVMMIIERKTLKDLISSIKDGRYEEQCYRLTHASSLHNHHKMYIIEGKLESLYTPMERKIVVSTLTSLQYFKGFSIMWTENVKHTAYFLFNFSEKMDKDLMKARIPYYYNIDQPCTELVTNATNATVPTATDYVNVVKKSKKQNVNAENIGHLMLCQIPGISSNIAKAILQNYESFPVFLQQIQENDTLLDNITITTKDKTRKISKTIIQNIKAYLIPNKCL